ncbi:MAG: M23 family metallopeptidase [Nitrospirae bacterium]|nr:M23 family metallopeptidase [Nitrospirota bacterium]
MSFSTTVRIRPSLKQAGRFYATLIVSLSAFFVISAVAPAYALQVTVSPFRISPGDPFIVKVTGVKSGTSPEATVKDMQLPFSSCGEGCFLAVGLMDLNSKPGSYTIALKIGGKKVTSSVRIKSVRFPVIHLTLSEDKVSLNPHDLARAEEEDRRLKSLWQIRSDRLWEGSFESPLQNELSTQFGTKRVINREKISLHKGVDIRGKEGEAVRAANSGQVVLAEELFFGGNTVIIDHGLGIFSVYMHLSGFKVSHGSSVSKGDVIGFVGSTGRSSGPHLHFGIKVQAMNANPVSFLKLKL